MVMNCMFIPYLLIHSYLDNSFLNSSFQGSYFDRLFLESCYTSFGPSCNFECMAFNHNNFDYSSLFEDMSQFEGNSQFEVRSYFEGMSQYDYQWSYFEGKSSFGFESSQFDCIEFKGRSNNKDNSLFGNFYSQL